MAVLFDVLSHLADLPMARLDSAAAARATDAQHAAESAKEARFVMLAIGWYALSAAAPLLTALRILR